jgi:hypothetical protein
MANRAMIPFGVALAGLLSVAVTLAHFIWQAVSLRPSNAGELTDLEVVPDGCGARSLWSSRFPLRPERKKEANDATA